jgi:hypothetical protein
MTEATRLRFYVSEFAGEWIIYDRVKSIPAIRAIATEERARKLAEYMNRDDSCLVQEGVESRTVNKIRRR